MHSCSWPGTGGGMKPERQELIQKYRNALQDYLAAPSEVGLQQAYQLGRTALNQGMGVLETAALEYKTLESYLGERHKSHPSAAILRSAANFMLEGLSPFEMTHRGFSEENSALRRLNEKLTEQIEVQAKRIGQTLHDEAGQLLTAVHIALAGLDQELTENGRQKIQEVEGLLRIVEQQLRSLSHELRPTILDDLGLMPALEFLARGVSSRSGVAIKVSGPGGDRLPIAVEIALYRMAQEALTNISKHAKANSATLSIERNLTTALCCVKDDGVGFDLRKLNRRRGLGLRGIQERLASLGGTLQVQSNPGKGTELRAAIPLAQLAAQAGALT